MSSFQLHCFNVNITIITVGKGAQHFIAEGIVSLCVRQKQSNNVHCYIAPFLLPLLLYSPYIKYMLHELNILSKPLLPLAFRESMMQYIAYSTRKESLFLYTNRFDGLKNVYHTSRSNWEWIQMKVPVRPTPSLTFEMLLIHPWPFPSNSSTRH